MAATDLEILLFLWWKDIQVNNNNLTKQNNFKNVKLLKVH